MVSSLAQPGVLKVFLSVPEEQAASCKTLLKESEGTQSLHIPLVTITGITGYDAKRLLPRVEQIRAGFANVTATVRINEVATDPPRLLFSIERQTVNNLVIGTSRSVLNALASRINSQLTQQIRGRVAPTLSDYGKKTLPQEQQLSWTIDLAAHLHTSWSSTPRRIGDMLPPLLTSVRQDLQGDEGSVQFLSVQDHSERAPNIEGRDAEQPVRHSPNQSDEVSPPDAKRSNTTATSSTPTQEGVRDENQEEVYLTRLAVLQDAMKTLIDESERAIEGLRRLDSGSGEGKAAIGKKISHLHQTLNLLEIRTTNVQKSFRGYDEVLSRLEIRGRGRARDPRTKTLELQSITSKHPQLEALQLEASSIQGCIGMVRTKLDELEKLISARFDTASNTL